MVESTSQHQYIYQGARVSSFEDTVTSRRVRPVPRRGDIASEPTPEPTRKELTTLFEEFLRAKHDGTAHQLDEVIVRPGSFIRLTERMFRCIGGKTVVGVYRVGRLFVIFTGVPTREQAPIVHDARLSMPRWLSRGQVREGTRFTGYCWQEHIVLIESWD